MPTFAYRALTLDGLDVSGQLEASDRTAALRELASGGTCVTELAERGDRAGVFGAATTGTALGGRVWAKQVAALTRQLAVALEAGLPLMTALDVVGQQLDHAPSRALLADIGTHVQQGRTLSDALAEHPRVFSLLYVRLVRVAETGGMLDTVLAELADLLDRQIDMRERVVSASIYPAILLLLGIVSVTIISTFIVPQILDSIGADPALLPLPTQMLMGLSNVIGGYWWAILGGSAAAAIAWRQLVLRGAGRRWWDGFKLRAPILGRLIRQVEAARFARSLGILTHGGVSITDALAVVCDTMQNAVIRNAVNHLAVSIEGGQSIAGPLQASGLFPPLLVQMVRVGESTGRLDDMLLRAAAVHEREARVTLDRLVNVLPVLMILVLALVIGFIVAALVLAIVEFQTTGFNIQ